MEYTQTSTGMNSRRPAHIRSTSAALRAVASPGATIPADNPTVPTAEVTSKSDLKGSKPYQTNTALPAATVTAYMTIT